MTNLGDVYVEAARLQKAIEEHLGIDGSLVFDYVIENNMTKLNLITVNQRHNQSFLFHSELGVDKIDSLKKMLAYVSAYKEKENSYTIQWILRTGDNPELQTSYFRARTIYEALDKLYFGKDGNSLVVYSVVLSPLT
jgi:carbamoylphosphate synthase large subunit